MDKQQQNLDMFVKWFFKFTMNCFLKLKNDYRTNKTSTRTKFMEAGKVIVKSIPMTADVDIQKYGRSKKPLSRKHYPVQLGFRHFVEDALKILQLVLKWNFNTHIKR